MEKPLPLQNAHLGGRGPSWAPLWAAPCPSGPPLSVPGANHFPLGAPLGPPRPTLAPPRPPKTAQGGARGAQGPHQIHKVNMLKTLEIHTFDLLGSRKHGLGRIFDPPRPPLRPSRVSTLIVRVPPGCPEGHLGAPRDPPRTPKDPPGSPQGPSKEALERRCPPRRSGGHFRGSR